MINKNKNL